MQKDSIVYYNELFFKKAICHTVCICCSQYQCLCTVQESSEISQLQQENAQLRQSLDDHQSAIELIMSRYRSRVSRLVAANRRQRAEYNVPANHSQVLHITSASCVDRFVSAAVKSGDRDQMIFL